jgi:hypothetical protein
MLSATIKSTVLSVVMQSAIMLNAVMLSVVLLNAVILGVATPSKAPAILIFKKVFGSVLRSVLRRGALSRAFRQRYKVRF